MRALAGPLLAAAPGRRAKLRPSRRRLRLHCLRFAFVTQTSGPSWCRRPRETEFSRRPRRPSFSGRAQAVSCFGPVPGAKGIPHARIPALMDKKNQAGTGRRQPDQFAAAGGWRPIASAVLPFSLLGARIALMQVKRLPQGLHPVSCGAGTDAQFVHFSRGRFFEKRSLP